MTKISTNSLSGNLLPYAWHKFLLRLFVLCAHSHKHSFVERQNLKKKIFKHFFFAACFHHKKFKMSFSSSFFRQFFAKNKKKSYKYRIKERTKLAKGGEE